MMVNFWSFLRFVIFSGNKEEMLWVKSTKQVVKIGIHENECLFFLDFWKKASQKPPLNTTAINFIKVALWQGCSPVNLLHISEHLFIRTALETHRKRCSEIMRQIYRRTPMLKCDFNKVDCNFIEITLWQGCSPVNLLQISEYLFIRTPLEGCL